MLSTILFSVVTPDCGLDSGPSTCSVLLTTLNNLGSKTLFNAVLIRPEQVVYFLLCILARIENANYCLPGQLHAGCKIQFSKKE